MPVLPFSKSKRPREPGAFLALDISSAAVKCLVFQASLDESSYNASVIGSAVENLEVDVIQGNIIVSPNSLLASAEKSIRRATVDVKEPVKRAIIGVKGPLCVDFMTMARSQRTDDSPVTKEELMRIYDMTTEAAYPRAQSELFQTTGIADETLEIVDSTVVYTKIDNKIVKDPVGSTGKEVEMAVFNSFVPKSTITSLKKLVKKLGLDLISIESEACSFTEILEYTSLEKINYVVINTDDDFTSVHVVFAGGIVTSKYIPIAKKHFVKEISEELGLTIEDAASMIREYSKGALSESEAHLVSSNMGEAVAIWLSGIGLMFAEFSGIKTFAPMIYLVGEGFDIPDVYESLITKPWTKSIPFKTSPDFRKITLEELVKVSDSTGKLTGSGWVLPFSLALKGLEEYDKN